MIGMKIELGDDFLKANVEAFEKQRIEVGVIDRSVMAAKPNTNPNAPLKTVKGTGGQGRRVAGRSKKVSMRQLAKWLDGRYGVFSLAAKNFHNRDLNLVTQELIKAFSGDPVNQKRIENAAIALVRNPIMRKDFGSNASTTIGGGTGYNGYQVQGKGFDWPMVDTGSFFGSIRAKYKG